MSYGVQTHNAFFLLDDEAPAPKPKAAPKVETPAPKPVKKTENSNGRDNSARNNRNNRDNRSRDGQNNRPRGGGAARGRGGRAPRDGKREFDRHESGTGRDRGAKKGGNGRGNWGTDADQAQGERQERPNRRERNNNRRPRRDDDKKPAAEKTEKADGETTEVAAAGEAPKNPKKEEVEEVQEEEEKTIGYDEYLKAQEAKKAEVDGEKSLRVATNDQFEGKVCGAVEKVEIEGPMASYAYTDAGKKIKGKKNRKKKDSSVLNIDEFMSKGKNSGRGQRGGRGRGRGGGRGGNTRASSAFNLDKDFPSIGGN